MTDSIRPFYADWAGYNRRTVEAIAALTPDDLALEMPGSDHWPVWALFAHTAGTRVYWLCHVFGEPGAESTPFNDPSGMGWEDDLATPRSGVELVHAYETSWRIVDGCLDRWTPAMLGEAFRREGSAGTQVHTRQSILLRMINHDAYHVGEVNLILGANGREMIDPWPTADWLESAPVARREG
ncbi:MAG: hypothetical protein QOI92_1299 [Chloroflexota bacterium]|jgi:uncharacterized damage-inducible protein DinB|nr:hypothetical protein [Chloroflexota bacterium]